jgi:hypothetical protein
VWLRFRGVGGSAWLDASSVDMALIWKSDCAAMDAFGMKLRDKDINWFEHKSVRVSCELWGIVSGA